MHSFEESAAEPENPEALVKAVRYFAANREIAHEMGEDGREHILRRYSRRHTAEKYVGMLERLLDLPDRDSSKIAA